jgi:hypothetical protein
MYREWDDAVSNGGDSKSQLLELALNKPRFSMIAGGKVDIYKYDYLSSEYNASINADLSSTNLFFGYVRNFSYWKLGGIVATDLKQVHRLSGLKGISLLRHIRLTSTFDYTLFCSATVKQLYLQTALTNRSVITGTVQIKNRSNNNYRFIDFDINKDSLSVKGDYDFGSLSLQCNLITEIFRTDTSQDDSRLLLSINGIGYGCITGVRFKALQYTPFAYIGLSRKEFSFRAFESTGDSFSKLKDLSSKAINAMVSLTFSRNSVASAFFESIEGTGGDGFFEVYPFTSWGVVFDIPDRYKVSDITMSLHNTGINWHYNKIFTPKHALTIQCALSYAKIDGQYTSQELVRYMGLLPVYQNLTVHTVKKEYLTFYPELVYTLTSSHLKTFLKLRQFLPLELKRHHSGDNGDPGPTGRNNSKKVFGGFNGVLGLEFRKKSCLM